MAALICLDVVDRPRGGAARAMLALRRLAKEGGPAGCTALVPCGTSHFNPTVRPRPTLRRVAVVSAWADEDAAARAGDSGPVAELGRGAREHWHVRCRFGRASGSDPWRGWLPETPPGATLADDDPVLVLISGELRPGAIPDFLRHSARAYREAAAHPGYLGGLGLYSSPLNTTSCSAWQSAAESRSYAFRSATHVEAVRNDREGSPNHRAERFLRLRPVASRGTLNGRDPFAGILASDG